MRTSILGVPFFHDLDKVKENTVAIARVTHADPRSIASSVAVTTAIALMLQGYFLTAIILCIVQLYSCIVLDCIFNSLKGNTKQKTVMLMLLR